MNRVTGSGNIVMKGAQSFVMGSGNYLEDGYSEVRGNQNAVQGTSNYVDGSLNMMKGRNNAVIGEANVITEGSGNRVTGDVNDVLGD